MFGEITYPLDEFRPFRAEDKTPLDVLVYGVATISYDHHGEWSVDRIDLESGRDRLIPIDKDTPLFKAIVAELDAFDRDDIEEAIALDFEERNQPDPDEKYNLMREDRMEAGL